MKILITGTAGFIGHRLVKELAVKSDVEIVGLDSINDYYEQKLKFARLADTGICKTDIVYGKLTQSQIYPNYRFIQADLTDVEILNQLFDNEHFTNVCNLAGQAGVRYSIENPYSYVQSNVIGFLNILENCRHHEGCKLVFASSSSVYGMDEHVPFAESDDTSHPVSLYAATKKSDEVMAYAYSKLYGIQTVALRPFTVYGPWGRPDMAPFKFLKAILEGRQIEVYNHGNMYRDFTYIDDIVQGIVKLLAFDNPAEVPASIYNIGCSQPVMLMDFIQAIEDVAGRKANMKMIGMQAGDVVRTYADTTRLEKDFGYKPSTSLKEGIQQFHDWYVDVYLKL
jgi:UDP-glucuronate 4-epimerase